MPSARDAVELFHLAFLRALFAPAEDRTRIALKGGCNLRFYFGSVRYSEDIDFDVTIAKHTLARKVERLLAAPPVVRLLRAHDLDVIDVTAPKQTETTQRWKLGLRHRGEVFRTKIEFSRRGAIDGARFEAVDDGVVHAHAMPRFLASHYGLEGAIVQKIRALADREVSQTRDVFDLYVLFARPGAERITLPKPRSEPLDKAIERAVSIGFDEFASQVVAFLDPSQATLYDDKKSWNDLQSSVIERLERLRGAT